MNKYSEENQNNRHKWHPYEVIGVFIVIVSLVLLFVAPSHLSNLFDTIIDEVKPIVVDTFLVSEVGMAVIVSVVVGRLLERFGFTDGLIRLMIPIMQLFKINPAVIIPSAYNILGDINAAGKISGPILMKSKATKAEQKIAVATMIQSPQSFATFVLGLIALSYFGIKAFPLIIVAIFLPMIVVPFILSRTLYRNTKAVAINELPRFTPKTPWLKTIFNSAREGIELLLLIIIPAVTVIFILIGGLKYAGAWEAIELVLTKVLATMSVEPSTGIVSVLVAPTLAVAQLTDLATSIDPRLIVGAFVLANSGLPIYVIIGQIPAIWADSTSLSEAEVIKAALVGLIIRVVTAFVVGYFLTPFLVM